MPADERATPEQAWAKELARQRVFVSKGTPLGDAVLAARDAALKEADRRAREDAARMGDEKREACTVLADLASPCCDHTWHAAQADAFREMSAAIRASITTDEGMR